MERELGRGGMGAVYAVVHDEIGKRAALKVVHSRLLGTGFNPDRMLVEARVVNQVGHPNIVDIFETGKLPDGRPYIVMERLEGQSLAHRVDERKLEPDFAIAILRQICDGLIAAHAAGIVHRDLKLDNVFLVDNLEEPTTPRVKILDWGIAKIVHHDLQHTVEGQLVGTPQYLSPEQARGGRVSPKTDVYSLGVMAYELFLDQLPFEAETAAEIMAMHLRATPPPPRALWPEIPPRLDELLLEMLAKQPDHRPTILDVANRLEAVRLEIERRRRSSEIAAVAKPATPSVPIPVHVTSAVQAPAPEAEPASAPPAPRQASAEVLAATGPARSLPRPQRWRYVVGGLAIASCVVTYFATRGGDRIASAAAPPSEAARARDASGARWVIAEPAPAEPAPAAQRPATAPATAPLTAPLTAPATRELATAPRPRPLGASQKSDRSGHGVGAQGQPQAGKPAGRARPAPSAAAPSPAASSPAAPSVAAPSVAAPPAAAPSAQPLRAPAAPRRSTRIDPDGTIDPYQ